MNLYTNPTEDEINNTPDSNTLIEEYDLQFWEIEEDKNLAKDILNYKKRKKEGEDSSINFIMRTSIIKMIVNETPTTISFTNTDITENKVRFKPNQATNSENNILDSSI